MGIVQTAISKIIAPALQPLADRIKVLEAAPGMTDADRVTLDEAAAIIAELEALAAAEVVVESVTVPVIV